MRAVVADATHVNYCFKIQALLRHRTTKKAVGSFLTYDKNLESCAVIHQLCALHESPTLECTPVEVTAHAVCPHPEEHIEVVFYAETPDSGCDSGAGSDSDSGYDSGYDGGSDSDWVGGADDAA